MHRTRLSALAAALTGVLLFAALPAPASAQAPPGPGPGAPPGSAVQPAEAPEQGPPSAVTPSGADTDAPGPGDRGGAAPGPEEPDRDGDDDWGEDDGGWGEGDPDDAFDSLEATMVELEADAPAPGAGPVGDLAVGGFLRQRSGLWVERMSETPVAQLRQSLDLNLRYRRPLSIGGETITYRVVADLHLEYDLAYSIDRDSYDQATLDAYESQVIGGEAFLAAALGPLELTLGRQIVAWGQGDMLSPLDIVNPRDVREPGLAELDDIRLAVLASRVGLFVGDHRLEVMAVHETRYGLRPAPLSFYSPLRALLLDDPAVAALIQGASLRYRDQPDGIAFDDRTQWLGRWAFAGPGYDLAFYGGRTLDRQGVVELPGPAPAPGPGGGERVLSIGIVHKPYWMVGHAGAKPLGDFVLKWEVGFDWDRPQTAVPAGSTGALAPTGIRRHQVNWFAGLTYAGIADGTIALEYAQGHVLDDPEGDPSTPLELLFPVEAPNLGLLFSQSYWRERLDLRVALAAFGLTEFLGWLGRVELTYELQDALHVGLGYVTYQPHGDRFSPVFGQERNDRLFASLRYDFLLD